MYMCLVGQVAFEVPAMEYQVQFDERVDCEDPAAGPRHQHHGYDFGNYPDQLEVNKQGVDRTEAKRKSLRVASEDIEEKTEQAQFLRVADNDTCCLASADRYN